MNTNCNNKRLALWLISCAAAIYCIIILGGVTRLTNSGLSMVDWQPIMGIIPPVTESGWQEAFIRYQQFPEYQKINPGMSLDEFKPIFLFEYAHRVLGRLIGMLFLLPFIYFLFKGYIGRQLAPRLAIIFFLGGLQGILGWYMVKSGLVDNPHVSQYRLTAHLGFAVIIYAYIIWIALGLLVPKAVDKTAGKTKGLNKFSFLITGLLFLMILSGGLVAGMDAGLVYGTFPLMGNSFYPPGLYANGWVSIFEDIATIQFNHRVFAYMLIFLIVSFAIAYLRKEITLGGRIAISLMLFLLATQVALGIATLLYQVPVVLAAAHQGCAILLFTSSLYISHSLHNRLS